MRRARFMVQLGRLLQRAFQKTWSRLPRPNLEAAKLGSGPHCGRAQPSWQALAETLDCACCETAGGRSDHHDSARLDAVRPEADIRVGHHEDGASQRPAISISRLGDRRGRKEKRKGPGVLSGLGDWGLMKMAICSAWPGHGCRRAPRMC